MPRQIDIAGSHEQARIETWLLRAPLSFRRRSPARTSRRGLKLGNGIVPQVADYIAGSHEQARIETDPCTAWMQTVCWIAGPHEQARIETIAADQALWMVIAGSHEQRGLKLRKRSYLRASNASPARTSRRGLKQNY